VIANALARRRARLALLVALGAAGAARPAGAGPADTVDVQSRAGLRVDVNLPAKWTVKLEYQNRMVDDLSTYRGSYFTLEADYRLTKAISALGAYRYALTDEGNASRFAAGLELEARLGKLKASFRPLIQYRTAYVADDDVGGDGDTFVRTRLRAEYPVTKRLDVYASVEPFFGFGGEYPVDNWRNEVGLQYAIARWLSVEPYYIYRPDYGKSYNRTYHVVGLDLRFKAKVRRR
jgi:hypothetical protein